MALPARQQIQYWSIAAIVTALALWYLGNVLLPYVIGAAIAFFLDPVADRIEAAGFSRAVATTVITLTGLCIIVLALLLVIPMLIDQFSNLVNTAPELLSQLRAFISDRFPRLFEASGPLRDALDALGSTLQEKGGELVQSLLSSALSLVNVVMVLVIAPVVAFYLLYDWDRMIASIDDMLPRDHAPVIRKLATEVNATLASFVRGMGTVCLILGTYYAIALMIVGLQFGLVVGFMAGMLTFIPYLGAILGGALAIGLALFQFWGDPFSIGLVAAVFFIGQIAEGNVLTPKLVGSSVGLHPVWLLLALSVFGALFGFVGMLVGVPVAAAIGVLVRFGVSEYKGSRLYKGLDDLEEDTRERLTHDAKQTSEASKD